MLAESQVSLTTEEEKIARHVFSQLGLGCTLILVISTGLQILMNLLLQPHVPDAQNQWTMWLITFAPLYLVAVPIGLAVMHRVPVSSSKRESASISPIELFQLVLISIAMMYIGNYIGVFVTSAIGALLGKTVTNALLTYAGDDSILTKMLFMVILAPMIEELIFRKTLIDRIRPYGEKHAVVLSAVMFGLFHGNFSQFFYATALGLVFGYVYLRSGKLRYSIVLHMLINFIGSVLSVWLLQNAGLSIHSSDAALLNGNLFSVSRILFFVYIAVMLCAAVAGFFLLLAKRRQLQFFRTELMLSDDRSFTIIFGNIGMVLFLLLTIILIVTSLLK